MKRIFLLASIMITMAFANFSSCYAQDDELFDDKKDTVSIDDMDPVFYEAEEEPAKSGNTAVVVGIVAGIVVVAAGAFFIIKKKKK